MNQASYRTALSRNTPSTGVATTPVFVNQRGQPVGDTPLVALVPSAGVEPATSPFVEVRSTQLSYEGMCGWPLVGATRVDYSVFNAPTWCVLSARHARWWALERVVGVEPTAF